MRQNISKLEELGPGKFCKASEKLCPPGPLAHLVLQNQKGLEAGGDLKEPGEEGEHQVLLVRSEKRENQEWLDLLDQNEVKET